MVEPDPPSVYVIRAIEGWQFPVPPISPPSALPILSATGFVFVPSFKEIGTIDLHAHFCRQHMNST